MKLSDFMGENAKGWLDLGFKWAVILGTFVMAYINVTYAKKSDLDRLEEGRRQAVERISQDLSSIKTSIEIMTVRFGVSSSSIEQLRAMNETLEKRVRDIETRHIKGLQ